MEGKEVEEEERLARTPVTRRFFVAPVRSLAVEHLPSAIWILAAPIFPLLLACLPFRFAFPSTHLGKRCVKGSVTSTPYDRDTYSKYYPVPTTAAPREFPSLASLYLTQPSPLPPSISLLQPPFRRSLPPRFPASQVHQQLTQASKQSAADDQGLTFLGTVSLDAPRRSGTRFLVPHPPLDYNSAARP